LRVGSQILMVPCLSSEVTVIILGHCHKHGRDRREPMYHEFLEPRGTNQNAQNF